MKLQDRKLRQNSSVFAWFREARVWELTTGEQRHVLRGHSSTIRCLKMCDSKIAVTGSRDTTLRIWDIENGTLRHLCVGHQASVRCLDIHGKRVASGSYDATARLWDIETGQCLHTFVGHHSQIYAVAFDGERVVTGSLDSHIRVWSPETGQCLATLLGHTSLVGHLQLLPSDPSILVSGGSDGCLRVWDLDNYECKHRISAHDNSVTCLQFDDRRIISGGSDGRVKLWDLETGTLVRALTQPARTVWKVHFNATKAVVVMQRQTLSDVQTAIELHNFDTQDWSRRCRDKIKSSSFPSFSLFLFLSPFFTILTRTYFLISFHASFLHSHTSTCSYTKSISPALPRRL